MENKYVYPFPRVLRIEPAGACNLKCYHCPTGTVELRRGLMSVETFSLVLQSIRDNISFIKVVVLYHGGEPFLNKNFTTMLRAVKAEGVPIVKTVTNGMLLSKNIIQELIDSGLDEIEFSLDGESPEQNNYIRRGCSYEKVIENIKSLVIAKKERNLQNPKIYVATTQFINPNEISENPRVPEFLAKDLATEITEGQVAGFKSTFAMEWPHMILEDELFEIIDTRSDEKDNNYCDHVENTLTIRWNGDVVSCCYDLTHKNVAGNIYKTELSSIWNNEFFVNLRRTIAEKRYLPLCSNCNVVKPNRYLCFKIKDN